MPELEQLLTEVITIAHRAGIAVMDIYNSGDFDVEIKADNSPLTRADKVANEVIETGLKQISDWPIMSEEGDHEIDSSTFWCVDPIDGTSDFIEKNGEFTVNIGLIKSGRPVLGVVLAPARDVIYYGSEAAGAFKQVSTSKPQPIEAKFNGKVPVIAVSRSHPSDEVDKFIKGMGSCELVKIGSSLKFCLVSEGVAAVYPKPSETHMKLWDAAAADAVLRAAGGAMVVAETGEPLTYDPSDINIPGFIASGL